MKFVCSEKGKKSRVHFPACCYTAKTRPKARKENIMPDQNHIVIQGLCQNNLKNISLKIPKQKLVVFTGVSGSGKSSIVFDTIAAESQRQMNETYSAYVRGRLPKYEKPKAPARSAKDGGCHHRAGLHGPGDDHLRGLRREPLQ